MNDIIRKLKSERGAVILCHNYQRPEIYDVADYIGDSLELAQRAQAARVGLIVFCGVRFMAETAAIVNPGTRVVLAEPRAGCQMADMATADAVRMKRAELGDVTVVAYVNTSAEVKAEADICCTSANVGRVVAAVPAGRRILMVPDRNLALYAARITGREVIPWEGFCYVHARFTVEDVLRARQEHPDATIIVHPECPPEVIVAADEVASTSGMLRLSAARREVVLGTEAGMCQRVRRELPGVICHPLRRTALCRNMKLTTLESVRHALEGAISEVSVPAETARRARQALERMLALA